MKVEIIVTWRQKLGFILLRLFGIGTKRALRAVGVRPPYAVRGAAEAPK